MKDCFEAADCPLRMIIAEWLNVTHIIECELAFLTFAQERKRQLPFHHLQQELFRLHMWRGRCDKYAEFLETSFKSCQKLGTRRTKLDASKGPMDRRAEDFMALHSAVERMKDQTQRQVDILLGWIALETGKQSVKESQRVTQLTFGALLFLPMTFVATLFSMTPPFAQNTNSAWMFWAVSIPLTGLVFYLGLHQWGSRQDITSIESPLGDEVSELSKDEISY